MPNKIVIIQGSPRKNGHTRAISAVAMATAAQYGAEVTEIDATRLDFKAPGCVACYQCQQSEDFKCALDDEVARQVATLPQYDAVVLATPLYWWSYSAQIKIFIDRMFSLSKVTDPENYRSLLAGKTLALLATAGGQVEDNLDLLEAQWKKPATMLGCRFLSCLFPNTPPQPGTLVHDPAAIEKAKAFGRALTSADL